MKPFKWSLFRSDCDDVRHVRMPRTTEGTVFEVVGLFLLIALWVVAVWMYRHAPETIPTHFDATGTPNNYGSRLMLIWVAVGGTLAMLLMFVCAYFPSATVNLPVKLNTWPRRMMASRLVRILALLMGMLAITIILKIGFPEDVLPNWLFFAFVGLIVVMPLVFVLIIKNYNTPSS